MKVFLDRDNSGHWYMIPAYMREVWEDWLNIDENDERSWEVPKGCYDIGGNPSLIEFDKPED